MGTTYRCGGYAAYAGHCGATDCETCYPGRAAEEAEEEAEAQRVAEAKVYLQTARVCIRKLGALFPADHEHAQDEVDTLESAFQDMAEWLNRT